MLSLIFWPYAVVIPHRHWLSHLPIVGTAGRLAYILFLAWEVALITGQIDWLLWVLSRVTWYWPVLVGLEVVATLHWVADGCPL